MGKRVNTMFEKLVINFFFLTFRSLKNIRYLIVITLIKRLLRALYNSNV